MVRASQVEVGKKVYFFIESHFILNRETVAKESAIGNPQSAIPSAIIPIITGEEEKAIQAAARLREQNIFVPAIRYPTVARGQARLRVTLTAAHTTDEVHQLATAIKPIVNRKS